MNQMSKFYYLLNLTLFRDLMTLKKGYWPLKRVKGTRYTNENSIFENNMIELVEVDIQFVYESKFKF
jgi:hypothetical protein